MNNNESKQFKEWYREIKFNDFEEFVNIKFDEIETDESAKKWWKN